MNFETARANVVLRVEKHELGVLVVTMWDTTILTRVQARSVAGDMRSQMRRTDKISVQCAVTDERIFRWSGDIKAASAFANDLIKHAGVASHNHGEE